MPKKSKVPTVEVSRAQLEEFMVPTPTKTHNPLPYGAMSDKVIAVGKQILEPVGYSLRHERYKVREDGSQMFGTITWSNGMSTDMDFMIGIRNSYDKSIAAGLCMGTNILVCDNMCFAGDIVIMRKNTVNCLSDFQQKVVISLYDANQFYDGIVKRMNRYKEIPVNERAVYETFGRASMTGVLAPQQYTSAIAEWQNPTHEEHHDQNVYCLYQAMNTPLKSALPRDVLEQHKALDDMFKAMWN